MKMKNMKRIWLTEIPTLIHILFLRKPEGVFFRSQALKNDYRQKCSVYFKEYFPKIYSEDELSENWEEYIAPNNQNFNKFIMTDDNIVFYFDRGTVLKESEGFVTAKVSNVVFGDSIRSSIIERYIQSDKPMVAITYDDGPGGESEEKILDCLEKNGAVATFFYLGSRVSGSSNNIRRAMEIGCEIGNHTWSHPILTNLTKKQAAAEVHKTNEAVKRACGQYPTVFRPSYGMTDKSINKLSDMPVIMWSVDTLDWKREAQRKLSRPLKTLKNLTVKLFYYIRFMIRRQMPQSLSFRGCGKTGTKPLLSVNL